MLHWHCGRTPWRRKNFIPCLQRESDGKWLVSAYVKVPFCIFYCSDAAKTEILSVWLQPRHVSHFVFLKPEFTEGKKDKRVFCSSSSCFVAPLISQLDHFNWNLNDSMSDVRFLKEPLMDHCGDNGPQRKTGSLPVFAALWSADLMRIEHFHCELRAESKTHKHGRVNILVKEQIKRAVASVGYQNVYSPDMIPKAQTHFVQITHTLTHTFGSTLLNGTGCSHFLSFFFGLILDG